MDARSDLTSLSLSLSLSPPCLPCFPLHWSVSWVGSTHMVSKHPASSLGLHDILVEIQQKEDLPLFLTVKIKELHLIGSN